MPIDESMAQFHVRAVEKDGKVIAICSIIWPFASSLSMLSKRLGC